MSAHRVLSFFFAQASLSAFAFAFVPPLFRDPINVLRRVSMQSQIKISKRAAHRHGKQNSFPRFAAYKFGREQGETL